MSLDYMHIGGSRTGSTWVFKTFIEQHPQLLSPSGKKQTFYWNWENHQRFLNRYRPRRVNATGKRPTLEWYKTLYKDRNGKVLCDATDGNSWLGIDRIQDIRKTYPNVKISYFIRNPITTIWSHVVKHDRRVEPTAPLENIKTMLTDPMYVFNTHFMDNIEHWLYVFPQEQVKLKFFTEIFNPVPLLKEMSNFLNIDATHWDNFNPNTLGRVINAGSRKVAIRKDVLDFLVDYHGPQIEALSHFFNKDLTHWLEGKE